MRQSGIFVKIPSCESLKKGMKKKKDLLTAFHLEMPASTIDSSGRCKIKNMSRYRLAPMSKTGHSTPQVSHLKVGKKAGNGRKCAGNKLSGKCCLDAKSQALAGGRAGVEIKMYANGP